MKRRNLKNIPEKKKENKENDNSCCPPSWKDIVHTHSAKVRA